MKTLPNPDDAFIELTLKSACPFVYCQTGVMIYGNDRRNSTQDLGLEAPVSACMRLWLSYIRIQMTLAKGGGGFIQIFTHNLLHHFIRIPTHNLPLSHSVLTRQIIRVGLKQITGELDLHKIPLKTSSSVTQTGLLGMICSEGPEPWFGLYVYWAHRLVAP